MYIRLSGYITHRLLVHQVMSQLNYIYIYICIYIICIYIYIWVNYNDLTATEPWKSWLVREIIPKWPQKFRLVKYYNLPRYIFGGSSWWQFQIYLQHTMYSILVYNQLSNTWFFPVSFEPKQMLDHGSPKQVYNLNFTRNALLIQTMQNWKLEIYGLLSSGQEGVKELGVSKFPMGSQGATRSFPTTWEKCSWHWVSHIDEFTNH